MAASESKRVIIAALMGNFFIAIIKFFAAIFTTSSAMFSEGVHSLVDVGNQALLLFGFRQANKKPSASHPYGYGREIYFWSFVVAILLFAFGGGISLYEGIKHLQHPSIIANIGVNYAVLSAALIFEGYAWLIAYRTIKKKTRHFHWFHSVNRSKDPALIVVLLEDTAAMLGLIIAFVGIALSQYLRRPDIDAMASIFIGIILLLVAAWLAYESKSLLIGESASPSIRERISKIINDDPNVDQLHRMLTMHMAPEEILLNLYIDFKNGISSQEVEATATMLEKKIQTAIPEIKWIYLAAKSFSREQNPKDTRHS
jgi:cation diffusion facilitator family transporter